MSGVDCSQHTEVASTQALHTRAVDRLQAELNVRIAGVQVKMAVSLTKLHNQQKLASAAHAKN